MTSPLNEKALEAALRAYGHECNSEETYDGAVPAAIRAYLSALPVVSDEEVAGLIDKLRAGTILASYGAPVTYGPPAIQSDAAAMIESLLSRAQAAEEELTAAGAEIDALQVEVEAYEHAASYDPMMSGEYRFKGWNRSQLDRARRITEERRAREALRATKKDAAP